MMAAEAIHFVSTSTVRPSTKHDLHGHDHNHHGEFIRRVELTPFDLNFLPFDYNQRGLLFPKPCSSSSHLFVQRLKAALSRALDVFYPLAGRLVAVENGDNTTSFFVDCNGEGALFFHAVIDGVTVADILQPVIPYELDSFFAMNGVPNHEAAASNLPLLAVQATELVDGVFVACALNHCIGDGATFWHFFNVWSELSRCSFGGFREEVRLSQPRPVIGREYFQGVIDLPVRTPFSPTKRVPPQKCRRRMVHFSTEKIAELKARANAEANAGTTDDYEIITISSLQALMAYLWVSMTRIRGLELDEEVSYVVLMGLRARLQPPLPQRYLGNAVGSAVAKSTAGELLKQGLGWAALQINMAIASQAASTEARNFFEDRMKSPGVTHVQKLPPNRLFTGSSPRFDLYGNDFGWGRPIAVRSGPANMFDGKSTVFPGAEEGSIDFELWLLPRTLEALARDEEFTKTIAA